MNFNEQLAEGFQVIDHLQQQALYLEENDMVQCSFNITDGAAEQGKYYQEAASKTEGPESDSEVKKKGRKRRQRRRKKNKAKEEETEEDIYCDEQPQTFLSDCDEQVVDDLNECMEMEMDQTEIADFLKQQTPQQEYDDEEFDQFDEESEEEEYDEEDDIEGSQDEDEEDEDEEDLEYDEEEEEDGDQDDSFFQEQKNKKTIQFRQEVQRQLELCLTDMLVNLYNSKEQSVYESLYIKVIQKLNWQVANFYPSCGGLTSKFLQELFIGTIKQIIQTVKRKLVEDSRKEKLIENFLNPNIKEKKVLEESLQQN